jgi:4-amino-4-deoxy-L-arabinose transferase-like glycosyltransferase
VPVRLRVREWLLLLGFCVFLFFYGLGQFGLVGADEPRYAQVAREMLAHHDWVTPTLNGTPWLEKPPLYYWQAMIAFAVFGVRDWAARVPSAVDATLIVLGVFLFLKKLRPGLLLDGALMAASAAGIIGFSHSASTDMPLAAMFTLSMLCWYAWWDTPSNRLLYGFYFFLALAVLAKGPVALFLSSAVIFFFSLASGRLNSVIKTLWWPGILLFAVVTMPWYVAVQLRHPEFFRVFILEHNLARFGTNLYHHTQPFWFYLPVAALALVPWLAFVIAAIAEIVQAWWSERKALFETVDAFNAFLLLWLAIPIAFFSLSRSKLPGYILPSIPAGSLLVAEYVRRHVNDDRPSLWLTITHSLIAAAPIVPALGVGYLVIQHRLPWSGLTLSAATIALLVAIGITVTLTSKLGLHALYFVTLIPIVLAVAALVRIGSPAVDETLSARPIAAQLQTMVITPMPLAVLGVRRETEYGLNFYRNEAISRYESGQIPPDQHLLLAPQGARPAIQQFVGKRRVSYLGEFSPQHLEFFWVAAANAVH